MAFPTNPETNEIYGEYIYNSSLGAWKYIEYVEDPTEGLVAYWPLNNNTNDIIGGNNGTLNGSPDWTTGPDESRALEFNGSPDGMEVPRPTGFMNTWGDSCTFSIWINIPSSYVASNANDSIMAFGQYSGALGLVRLSSSAASVGFYVRSDTGQATPGGYITLGSWNHIVGTWNGTRANFYLNGEYEEGADISTSGVPSGDSLIRIAGNYLHGGNSSNWFEGKISEPRLYDRALDEEEIKILYDYSLFNRQKYLRRN